MPGNGEHASILACSSRSKFGATAREYLRSGRLSFALT